MLFFGSYSQPHSGQVSSFGSFWGSSTSMSMSDGSSGVASAVFDFFALCSGLSSRLRLPTLVGQLMASGELVNISIPKRRSSGVLMTISSVHGCLCCFSGVRGGETPLSMGVLRVLILTGVDKERNRSWIETGFEWLPSRMLL